MWEVRRRKSQKWLRFLDWVTEIRVMLLKEKGTQEEEQVWEGKTWYWVSKTSATMPTLFHQASLPGASNMCMLVPSASPYLFACCVIARTLQAVMVGAVTNDRLWQTLQEKQQGFSYRMIASSFWPIVKEQVMMLPMVRRPRASTC